VRGKRRRFRLHLLRFAASIPQSFDRRGSLLARGEPNRSEWSLQARRSGACL